MKREFVAEFRQKFHLFASERLTADDMRPQYLVDARTSFSELTEQAIADVFSLAPFGFGNPAPLLMTEHVEVAGSPRLLSEGKHLKIPLRHQGRVLYFMAWHFGDRAGQFQRGQKMDVLFTIEDDPGSKARGYDGWSLSLKDVRPA
jgi:single-stranded-DNA-specific exonuclease